MMKGNKKDSTVKIKKERKRKETNDQRKWEMRNNLETEVERRKKERLKVTNDGRIDMKI